ncbi:uncharacterized protein LOC116940401 [Petromyzon marinus]|uniref:Cyclic AMP-dependent transcription factor ATF-4-like n=1 Tax=Petromyzon marinus TaxID=7757 RepID=A0AAJ7WQH9_PETMA|nr:cyclic AMP-dependent transcription factor ATF-4-like [Petromyzon marinus]
MSRLLSSLIMDVDDRLLLLPGLEEQLPEARPVCPLLPAEGAVGVAQPPRSPDRRVCGSGDFPTPTLLGTWEEARHDPYDTPLLSPIGGNSLVDTIDLELLVDELMGDSTNGILCLDSLLEPSSLHGTEYVAVELDHTEEESPFDLGVSALFTSIEDTELMELSDLDLLESSSWISPTSPIVYSSHNNSIIPSTTTDSDTVSTVEVARQIDSDTKVNSDINLSHIDVPGWISKSDLQSRFPKCGTVVESGVSKSYDHCSSSSGYSSDTSDRPDSQIIPLGSSAIGSDEVVGDGAALLGQQLLTVAATALSGGCERRLRKKQQNQRAAVRYRQRKRTEHDTLKGTMSGEQARNRQLRERVDAISKELLYLRGLLEELYGTSLSKQSASLV